METRDLRPGDWPEVARIYEKGIATGNATFETEVPSWEAWDAAHLAEHRFVAERAGRVAGWIALVIDAVEEQTGHVGVTVVEAVGHGRERGITHEYRGRVFESRFLPKALLTFVVEDSFAAEVAETIADAARSGNESGDGLVWTTPVENVIHHRTGLPLERAA